ncbi:hypothetical protein FI667_g4299, partial [Globisporangium splendens]
MSFLKICTLASVMHAAAMLPSVDAHGFLVKPTITFIESAKRKPNFWAWGIAAETNGPVSAYTWYLSEEVRQQGFEKNFIANGFKSLKDYILDNQKFVEYQDRPEGGSKDCGFSDPNGPAQPLPEKLQWLGPTFQHSGPCEAWCDNERVMYAPSCKKWEASAGAITYDKDKCVGKSRLTFYWLATFNVPFQVYTNCVALQGAAPGASSNATSSTPAAAPTPAMVAPTQAPATKSPPSGPAKTTAPTPIASKKPTSCKRAGKK